MMNDTTGAEENSSMGDDGNSIQTAGVRENEPYAGAARIRAERAEAAAEVAAMQGTATGRRGERRAGDEAIMGAAEDRFEVVDESGELVMQRFVQFLGEL